MSGSVPDDEPDAPVLFTEHGSSWWPLAWGPLFAAVGAGAEATTGPVHWLPWFAVGVVLFAVAVVWVSARRKVYFVRLTTGTLTQGREHLAISRIAKVTDVGAPTGAKVLGGGWVVPRRTVEIPVRLVDDKVVLAWARDDEGLREALRRLVEAEAGHVE